MNMNKELFLQEHEIDRLINNTTFALVSDAVSVYGEKVGYMEREQSTGNFSGWVIYSGTEERAYLADAANFEYLQLNYVCNCDTSIIGLLDSPVGSKFYKNHNGNFVLFDCPDEQFEYVSTQNVDIYQ